MGSRVTNRKENLLTNKPIVARREPKEYVYCPPWLAAYARKNNIPADVYAFKHAIEATRTNVEAAKLLGISGSTFTRCLVRWQVTIER
jgi:hypothetical protein